MWAKLIFIYLISLFYGTSVLGQTELGQLSKIDQSLLNTFITQEVNKYRKKAKVGPVATNFALVDAAEDHTVYIEKKRKLTHFQRKRIKKTPKNRVDFYGQQFQTVGENIQVHNLNLDASPNDKKHPKISSYEALAAALVLAWKNSPPHYKNMINPNFKATYTAVSVNDDGEVYACQLFGGATYTDKYADVRDSVEFKPDRSWRCWRCNFRPPAGGIEVTKDSLIVFTFATPRFWGIPIPAIKYSRMRFFNPWRDGLAADIIVKSQYPCGSNSYFNGISNVRGIPLPPVYKKDYMGIGIFGTEVVLGKVPSYIDEEFEVNLIVVQNKRPCSNTMFNVIPSDFHVDLTLDYDFEPSDAKVKMVKYDTLSERIYFEKSSISPLRRTDVETLHLKNGKDTLIEKVHIAGFSSVEGSTEANIKLYESRAQSILKEINLLAIDSNRLTIQTAENFSAFREDVKGTKFDFLAELSDEEIKEALLNSDLSDSLEYLLKNHRYVDLEVIRKINYEIDYDTERVNEQLKTSIAEGNTKEALEFQRVQYNLALSRKMNAEDIRSVEIPFEKKYAQLLHNKALMEFALDSMDLESLLHFRGNLENIVLLKERDKQLNTSLAIIDYHLYENGFYRSRKYHFYDTIRKRKHIDRAQQARILLNVASEHDWDVWRSKGTRNEQKYMFRKAKSYVKSAKLSVDKTFEIASYYSFFWQHKYAYALTKSKIDETENPLDLIFFLKLVHLTYVKLPRSQYLRYFKKIREYAGDDFCTFFNNPQLNFQILDDEEIKAIYCEACQNTDDSE